MREIKVRAWNKGARKWRVVTSLCWYKPDTGKAGVCGAVIVTDTNHDQFMPIEDIELVEFTGLHDKNGVEIYEGDVGRFIVNGKEVFGYVGYYAGQWLIYLHLPSEKHWFDGYTLSDVFEGKYFPSTEGHPFEVIGNIYSNPDLLK